MDAEPPSTLLIAAHPDDEVIGCGIWMARRAGRRVIVVHTTDGSPRDLHDAREAGLATREEYTRTRREELYAALALVGVSRASCLELGYIDKESYLHLAELSAHIARLIEQLRPALVLSPAYEGGHPDHDGAAFAAAAARAHVSHAFTHREYPLYHAGPHGMITGEFLPAPGEIETLRLSPAEQELKRAMIARFPSQQHVLVQFQTTEEIFRKAPAYDFSSPPHPGPLQYELWNWGITGEDWRKCAAAARAQFRQIALV